MKLVTLGLLAITSVSAQAAGAKVLLSKVSGGGYTMADYVRYEKCDLYQNKVVISHQYGHTTPTSVAVVEEKKLSFQGDLAKVIAAAAKEKIEEKPNGLCDGPSTFASANPNQADALVLFSTGGCGSPEQTRNGVSSEKLRAIMDLYCPITYKFAQDR